MTKCKYIEHDSKNKSNEIVCYVRVRLSFDLFCKLMTVQLRRRAVKESQTESVSKKS